MDYAMRAGVSLSTLRRHIKANKIQYKIENGKYLIWAGAVAEEYGKLKTELQRAQEEIAELKTLIALYEEKLPHSRASG